MPLRIFNTLSGKLEEFRPLKSGEATFYTCGPTVYDYAHIGNFRSFLTADVLRRWLESPLCQRVSPEGAAESFNPGAGQWGGYNVTQVMNITDVGHMTDDAAADGGGEDKLEAARKRLLEDKKAGKLPGDAPTDLDPSNPYHIANYYAHAFLDDAKMLGLRVVDDAAKDPSLMPRPTQMIREMLLLVIALIEGKYAYVGRDGVCYFDTQTFPAYGQLSGNTIEKIRSGAGGRVSEHTQSVKKHPADFMLWKPDPRHLMRWNPTEVLKDDSGAARKAQEFGLKEGYPGWHLECSAMAQKRLGEVIDLHSGGEDNIFPHHECEIAQSRCASGRDAFARFWVHTRFLMVEGAKMSKSKGNFFTVRDLVKKGFSPAAIRLELIKTHYRQNANFTEQGLRDSQRMIDRWREFLKRCDAAPHAGRLDERAIQSVADAFNDDLNIAGAIGAINTWINRAGEPTRSDAEALRLIDGAIGVLDLNDAGDSISRAAPDGFDPAHVDDLIRRRNEARKNKNWVEADKVRDELAALNITLIDTPDGTKWERKATL